MGIWQWLQTIFSDGEDRLTDKQLLRLENFAQAVKTTTARQVIHIQAQPSPKARPYDIRGKAYLKQNSKYFIVDNGLRNQIVSYKDGNKGNRLENIVFLELIRRGYKVDVVRIDNKEVDFVARKKDSLEYYQVAYQLPSNTHETDNLLMINDNFKKFLITGRYEEVDNVDGIKIKYIVDWLLED